MSVAVSSTNDDAALARLSRPSPRLDLETSLTAAAAIALAIAELHANPERYAHLTPDARAEFICDAARRAVRGQRAARLDGPEVMP